MIVSAEAGWTFSSSTGLDLCVDCGDIIPAMSLECIKGVKKYCHACYQMKVGISYGTNLAASANQAGVRSC